jgi:hypothetical protein
VSGDKNFFIRQKIPVKSLLREFPVDIADDRTHRKGGIGLPPSFWLG